MRPLPRLHVVTAASAERPQLSISNAPVHVQELVDVRADQLLGAWESHLGKILEDAVRCRGDAVGSRAPAGGPALREKTHWLPFLEF